jgi:hypothetical protein
LNLLDAIADTGVSVGCLKDLERAEREGDHRDDIRIFTETTSYPRSVNLG